MSDNISLPIQFLRQAAEQIIAETDTLSSETSSQLQHLRNANGNLPGSMQGSFFNLLAPLQNNLGQIISLRQSIGQTLIQAADQAEATEAAIDAPLVEH